MSRGWLAAWAWHSVDAGLGREIQDLLIVVGGTGGISTVERVNDDRTYAWHPGGAGTM